jgi:hypothetical protein
MMLPMLLMIDAARHKSRIFQLDTIRAFMYTIMRSRVCTPLPKTYGEVLPEFREYCGKLVMLIKTMYGMKPSGKYVYEEFKDWLASNK